MSSECCSFSTASYSEKEPNSKTFYFFLINLFFYFFFTIILKIFVFISGFPCHFDALLLTQMKEIIASSTNSGTFPSKI